MTIVIDTREQRPFWKGDRFTFIALNVGDYTTEALAGVFHIERKSLGDLYGTLTKGHARFRREIARAAASNTVLVVVVEGSRAKMLAKDFPKGNERKLPGSTIVKIADTLSRRTGVAFHWCRDREAAKRKTLSLLREAEREMLAARKIERNQQSSNMAKTKKKAAKKKTAKKKAAAKPAPDSAPSME